MVLQAGGNASAPTSGQAVALTKERIAKNAHDAFGPEAARLAGTVLGASMRPFAPRKMTNFAWWYEDDEATRLVAVVAPTEVDTVTDEVLAYALAWQHERDLILILSDKHSSEVARRIPWIDASVTIRSFEGDMVVLSRQSVLADAASFKERTTKPYALHPVRAAWIEPLLTHPVLEGLGRHPRASYLSWHHSGLQVLRVSGTRTGIRIEAGVQYSKARLDHQIFNTALTGPITDSELALVVEAIAGSVASTGSLPDSQTEHRLQSHLGASPPEILGLDHLAREYPAYRGPGRPGFIDFLGCDPSGNLHIVETKVGHDPKVVLQALDYGIWVLANEQSVRISRPDWPRSAAPQTRIFLDFVLAAGDEPTAVDAYLAGQLEVLAADVQWRVFIVEDLDARPVVLTEEAADRLWAPAPGRTSQPVQPKRRSASSRSPEDM